LDDKIARFLKESDERMQPLKNRQEPKDGAIRKIAIRALPMEVLFILHWVTLLSK
jgi:hypothetical protein